MQAMQVTRVLAYGHNGDHTTWSLSPGPGGKATLSFYGRKGDRVVCVKQEVLDGLLTAIGTNRFSNGLDASTLGK